MSITRRNWVKFKSCIYTRVLWVTRSKFYSFILGLIHQHDCIFGCFGCLDAMSWFLNTITLHTKTIQSSKLNQLKFKDNLIFVLSFKNIRVYLSSRSLNYKDCLLVLTIILILLRRSRKHLILFYIFFVTFTLVIDFRNLLLKKLLIFLLTLREDPVVALEEIHLIKGKIFKISTLTHYYFTRKSSHEQKQIHYEDYKRNTSHIFSTLLSGLMQWKNPYTFYFLVV